MSEAGSRGNSAHRAYEYLRSSILRDEWPEGGRLREAEIAARLGVSRTPVRDALRRLASEGLVEFEANVGCRVSSWPEEDLEAIFSMRIELESLAASRAATRLPAVDLLRLERLAAEMERSQPPDFKDIGRRSLLTPLNAEFHAVIMDAAANERLRMALAQVVQVPVVTRTFSRYTPGEVARSMAHHRELLDAFAARDSGWAEAVMRAHIHAGMQVMRRGRRALPGEGEA